MCGCYLNPYTRTSQLNIRKIGARDGFGSTILQGGLWSGRIEHVVSGQATRFQSLADLLAFIGRVLATGRTRTAHEEEDID